MKSNYFVIIFISAFCFCHILVQASPIVTSFTPIHNALNVVQNTIVTVNFDTAMDATTFTDNTVRINGLLSGLHKSTFSYNSSTRTATITPNASFRVGEVVTVTLTHGIKDTNGDSLLNSYIWNFTIKVNSGTGFFQQAPSVNAGNQPCSAAVADFNGDGKLDLAIANVIGNGTVSILTNSGNATFTLTSTINVGSSPISVATADFDGDGYMDLATANSDSNSISILKNNGSGIFTRTSTISVGNRPYSVTVVDVDGNGSMDLAVANYYDNTVSILKNNGNGTFTQTSVVNVSSSPISVISADVNSDGAMDLIVAGNGAVSILKNNGSGTFTETSVLCSGISSFSVAAADLDGDGAVDLAITNSGSTSVLIFKNDGSGTFTQTSTITVENNPRAITAVDMYHDGVMDLAVANYFSNSVSILKNNGSGSFTQTSTVTVGNNPRSIISADLDGDGGMDLVVTNLISNTVSILKARHKNASLRLFSTSLSFSPVANGINRNLYLKISNDGTDSSLIITNIVSSNAAFTVDRISLTIPPLSCDSILVMFSPTTSGITYNYNDSLMITSNDSVKPIVKVPLKAVPISIWDVPNDNGKQVYIKWLTMGSPINFGITKFGIYRYNDSVWTSLFEIAVLTDSIYQNIAPTLVDSTGGNEKYWSSFRIIAYTANPAIYTIIGSDSGYSVNNVLTGIKHANSEIPKSFNLSQNYPNPFNPSTTIQYALPSRSQVRIRIFNILGQIVIELANNEQAPGYQSVLWNAKVASGMYFYRIEATDLSNPNNHFVDTKKMILLK
jgi:Bacterial Ig-like domain/FG-GAP-like repeat/Secretion system C-terminal sorting domain/Abnormal spindle-like microcephaly-assoc'd, ASPM-SPD-2-Hydin